MRYFEATVELGHLGAGCKTDTKLYIMANSILEAMDKAKSFGAVKHKKTPTVIEISKDEYFKLRNEQKYNSMKINIFGGET